MIADCWEKFKNSACSPDKILLYRGPIPPWNRLIHERKRLPHCCFHISLTTDKWVREKTTSENWLPRFFFPDMVAKFRVSWKKKKSTWELIISLEEAIRPHYFFEIISGKSRCLREKNDKHCFLFHTYIHVEQKVQHWFFYFFPSRREDAPWDSAFLTYNGVFWISEHKYSYTCVCMRLEGACGRTPRTDSSGMFNTTAPTSS